MGTTDKSSWVHTTENIAEITTEHIKEAETRYEVKASAIITDNADMSKMRKIVGNELNVIEYGCAAHQINLVAKIWLSFPKSPKLQSCSETATWVEIVEKRYEKSVPKVWFLANVVHPQYVGASLTNKEWKDGKDCVSEYYPGFLPDFIEFIGSKKDAFTASFCSMNECRTEDSIRSQILTGEIGDKTGKLALKLYALPPLSAGIDRVFSTVGYVHSDIRDRLGQEKRQNLLSLSMLFELIIQRFNHNMWLFLFDLKISDFLTVFNVFNC